MTCYATLILLFSGWSLVSSSRFPLRTYYYVNLEMSWSDAQQYCRLNYDDLATIESLADINLLSPRFSYNFAWIGLNDDPNNWKVYMRAAADSWRWSSTEETSKTGYQNWDIINSEPQSRLSNENCAMMFPNGLWADVTCENPRNVLCSNVTDQNQTDYVSISGQMSWSSAQAYCRTHYTDLPTIESRAENIDVSSAKPPNTAVWLGLYRIPWSWSDKSQSLFKLWKSGQPDNANLNQYCVAEDPSHQWLDDNCVTLFPFICHRVSKLKTIVRMTIMTDANISSQVDAAQILQQLGSELTSRGWTRFSLRLKVQPRKEEEAQLTSEQLTV